MKRNDKFKAHLSQLKAKPNFNLVRPNTIINTLLSKQCTNGSHMLRTNTVYMYYAINLCTVSPGVCTDSSKYKNSSGYRVLSN